MRAILNVRRWLSLGLAMVMMLAVSSAAIGAESRILRVTTLAPNPGLLDVHISTVTYDAASGEITITGAVECVPDLGVQMDTLEFYGFQERGRSTIAGYTQVYGWSAPCGSFSGTVAASEGRFQPGRATLYVTVFVCGPQCAAEIVQIDAVLVPSRIATPGNTSLPSSRQSPRGNLAQAPRHLPHDALLTIGHGFPLPLPDADDGPL